MKTFMDYLGLTEDAPSFVAEKRPDQRQQDADAMEIAATALRHLLKTKPEMIVAFLNQQRMDPDIRQLLNKHNLDAFLDVKRKVNNGFSDKGLGDRTGEEHGEEVKPPVADGFSLG